MVEFIPGLLRIIYIQVFLRKSMVKLYEKISQQISSLSSQCIEFLNDKVKDVFFSLNDNFSLQNANVAHKTHILTCLTYLINDQ
jgi:hypothetical protein